MNPGPFNLELPALPSELPCFGFMGLTFELKIYYVDLWFHLKTCRSVLVFPNGVVCNITKR